MTDMFEQENLDQRLVGSRAIQQELRQFKLLQHLSDADVAFRMATSLNGVRNLRKSRNQLDRPLYDTNISYNIRVILGERGIKTTGELFKLSDKDLKAIPLLGPSRVEEIREGLKVFFG